MKKLLSIFFAFVLTSQSAMSLQVDTKDWASNPESVNVSAFELDLKSDLRNDFRFYQVSFVNKTKETVDITIDANKKSNDYVNRIIKERISLKELMQVPKEIAVESYKEDVGTGKIAKAHKGLIYLSTTAGVAAAGAGFLGLYPQQKFEEYISHKRIKKEYKKITAKIPEELTVAPMEQVDFLMLVPLDEPTPFINILSREKADEVYTEFHQL